MTRPEGDHDLREMFSAQRREDEARAPAFARVREAGGVRRRSLLRPALLGLGGAALAGVALVAVGVRRPAPSPPLAPSITEWKSPTDFLLRTPGREILETLPRFGGDLPPSVLSPPPKERRPS